MFFAVSSHGVLTQQDMLKGLEEERVCPVMVFTRDGVKKVPLFASSALAYRFAFRNTHKSFHTGAMEASEEDIEAMRQAGYEPEEQLWPNKRTCDMHLLQLTAEVKTHRRDNRTRRKLPRALPVKLRTVE
jgi:hypothetical protein